MSFVKIYKFPPSFDQFDRFLEGPKKVRRESERCKTFCSKGRPIECYGVQTIGAVETMGIRLFPSKSCITQGTNPRPH